MYTGVKHYVQKFMIIASEEKLYNHDFYTEKGTETSAGAKILITFNILELPAFQKYSIVFFLHTFS